MVRALTDEEKHEVHAYLFCKSAALDITGTHVRGDDKETFDAVAAYLAFLSDRVEELSSPLP